MLPLLPALIQIVPAPPPPSVPGKEVVVQGKRYQVPPVPTTVAQAHAEGGRILGEIELSLQDLEMDLVRLYQEGAGAPPLPASIHVHASEAETARFYSTMLNDDHYLELEDAVIAAWNRWQGILVETGLAERSGAQDRSQEGPTAWTRELEKRSKDGAHWQETQADVAAKMSTQSGAGGGSSLKTDKLLAILSFHVEYHERILTAQSQVAIANDQAPALAAAWDPLVAYLYRCAVRMVDLEHPAEPYRSADLLNLQRLAKIRFLERCRSALAFSQTIWARMTSGQMPPPLKDLSPAPLPPGSPVPVTPASPPA